MMKRSLRSQGRAATDEEFRERKEKKTEKNLQCPLCPHRVKHICELYSHTRTHTLERPWQCDLCKASYTSSNSLKQHRILKHGQCSEGDEMYQCGQCDYSTTSYTILRSHLVLHSEKGSFACSFPGCNIEFKTAATLKRHRFNIHDDSLPIYECPHPDCSYKTKRKDSLRSHLKFVHGPSEKIRCSEPHCTYVAKNELLLKSHMVRHREKKFKCSFPECKDSFTTERALSSHLNVHDPSRPFRCEFCPYRGKLESTVSAHTRNKHSADTVGRATKCPFCLYRCEFPSGLKTHIERRHKAEPFKCPERGCSYQSHSDQMLRSHKQKMHNPASRFICQLCSSRFKTQLYLEIHTRTVHEGKKDFQCPQCEHRTTSRFKLALHVKNKHPSSFVRTASDQNTENQRPSSSRKIKDAKTKSGNSEFVQGAENFICPEPDCGHMSYNRSALNVHMKLHSDERKFPCHLCSLRFSNNGKLGRHVNTFHEEGPSFMCAEDGCEYATYSQLALDYHMKFHDQSRPLACPLCPMRFDYQRSLEVHLKSNLTHAKQYRKEEADPV